MKQFFRSIFFLFGCVPLRSFLATRFGIGKHPTGCGKHREGEGVKTVIFSRPIFLSAQRPLATIWGCGGLQSKEGKNKNTTNRSHLCPDGGCFFSGWFGTSKKPEWWQKDFCPSVFHFLSGACELFIIFFGESKIHRRSFRSVEEVLKFWIDFGPDAVAFYDFQAGCWPMASLKSGNKR